MKPREIESINLSDFWLIKRTLFLFSEVNEHIAETLIKKINLLDSKPQLPITLMINSGGGSVHDGLSIINAIQACKSPIETVITGQACSTAGLIAIYGDTRRMHQHSVWMIHGIRSDLERGEFIHNAVSRTTYLNSLTDQIIDMYQERTKLKRDEIEAALIRELWLSPAQCVEKGVVEGII